MESLPLITFEPDSRGRRALQLVGLSWGIYNAIPTGILLADVLYTIIIGPYYGITTYLPPDYFMQFILALLRVISGTAAIILTGDDIRGKLQGNYTRIKLLLLTIPIITMPWTISIDQIFVSGISDFSTYTENYLVWFPEFTPYLITVGKATVSILAAYVSLRIIQKKSIANKVSLILIAIYFFTASIYSAFTTQASAWYFIDNSIFLLVFVKIFVYGIFTLFSLSVLWKLRSGEYNAIEFPKYVRAAIFTLGTTYTACLIYWLIIFQFLPTYNKDFWYISISVLASLFWASSIILSFNRIKIQLTLKN